MKLGLVALVVAVLAACTPQPPVPVPQPDADAAPAPPPPPPTPIVDAAPAPPATPCQAACQALAGAGCTEGTAPGCAAALTNADARRLVRTPSGAALTCVAVAAVHTPADARALGITCLGPP